jgi:hypothetical protein
MTDDVIARNVVTKQSPNDPVNCFGVLAMTM